MARELSETTRTLVRSRIENYGQLTEVEAAREAIKVIAKDFYIYCERNLMIKDKRGQMIPLDPNWAQKILVEMVLADILAGKPVRYIILKARQLGLSTIIEALCFWWTTTHRYINSVIIAHEKKAANNLYKMFRRFYDNSHEFFRPDRKYNTKQDLSFDIEDAEKEVYIKEGKTPPGLGSEIQTFVAKEGSGRSDTILFLHGSEVAFWDDGSDVLSSALQAVPLLANTFVFLESTANGLGGYFYNEWQHARKGESAFTPVFFAWHEHPEYALPGDIENYDDEERELMEIFEEKGYGRDTWDSKIIWRREKKKEFRSDPKKFYQEYPKDDMEAFLASGRAVFDIKQLQLMEKRAMAAPPPMFGAVMEIQKTKGVLALDFIQSDQKFYIQDPTPLKVWELPAPGDQYTIGVDVAEGLDIANAEGKKEGDFSVIDVMNLRTGKTAARWRGHIDPDLLGDEVVTLGKFYNYALVGVEINNHGLTTVQRIRNLMYRNLYMRESSEEDQFQERTSKMGWKTDRKTKPLMINELAKAIREDDLEDLDMMFIRECMTYVRDDQGYTNAQEGTYDDCVVAKAINLQMAAWNSYSLSITNIHKPLKRETKNDEDNPFAEAVGRRRTLRKRHRNAR